MKKFFSSLLTAAITASLLILPSHAAEFSDVPEDHWEKVFFENANRIYHLGLLA